MSKNIQPSFSNNSSHTKYTKQQHLQLKSQKTQKKCQDSAIQSNAFMVHCYTVMQQQNEHIEQLQKDNARKDSIIATLLKKKQIKGSHCNLNDLKDRENLMCKVEELKIKLQHLEYRNQCNEIMVKEKQSQILKMNKVLREMENREKQMLGQIQNDKEIIQNINEKYEQKIHKLLGELRKKIQEDYNRSKQKRKNRFEFQSEYESSQQNGSVKGIETPRKQQCYQNFKQISTYRTSNNKNKSISNKKNSESKQNQCKFNQHEQKVNPENNERTYCKPQNFVVSRSKPFPTSRQITAIEAKKKLQEENYDKSSSSESQFRNYEQSSESEESIKNEYKSFPQKSISIKRLVKQFQQLQKQSVSQKQIQEAYQYNSTQETLRIPQTKIIKIVNDLSERIKRFEEKSLQMC